MILGIGTDVTDVRRIERALARFGDRFTHRVFTAVERGRAERTPLATVRAASYAKRFAAKEACAKALGTGMRAGVFWRDMGVVNARSGRPTLVLAGGAARRLSLLTPSGRTTSIHLSLSDEPPFALAFVVLEADALTPGGDLPSLA